MSDKEKLLKMLEYCHGDSIEEILFEYLDRHHKEFPASRVNSLINELNKEFLTPKVLGLEYTKAVAKERALFLKTYLEGDMYRTKEVSMQHIPVQIRNAQAIIDACNGKNDRDDLSNF